MVHIPSKGDGAIQPPPNQGSGGTCVKREISIMRAREIFARELKMRGEHGLAELVLVGADNSHGGQAAIAAIMAACEEQRG